jgi:hypothetical protein
LWLLLSLVPAPHSRDEYKIPNLFKKLGILTVKLRTQRRLPWILRSLAGVFSDFKRENRLLIPFKAVFNTALDHYLVTHIYPPLTNLGFEPGGQSCSVMLPSSGFVDDPEVDGGVTVVVDSSGATPKKFG